MSTDFSHLKKHSQKADETRPFVISYDGEAVRVHCLPATEANKPYWNVIMRRVEDSAQRRKAKLNDKTTAQGRRDDAVVFAEHCIKGWDEDPVDKKQLPLLNTKGDPVKFSPEEAKAFMLALAEHVDYAFDDLRAWLTNPENFVGEAAPGVGSELGN